MTTTTTATEIRTAGVVRFRAQDRLLPRASDIRADAPLIGVLALAGLLLSWKAWPAFGSHGASFGFWLGAGAFAGVVLGSRGRALLSRPRWSARETAAGAAVGFLAAGFAGRPLAVGLGLLALVAVTPLVSRVLRTRSAQLAAAVVGLAPGLLVGAYLSRLLCVLAAVACGAVVVLLTRKAAAPTAMALLVLTAVMTVWPALPQALAGDRRTVEVPSSKDFVDSGITVAAGEVVHVKASGTVEFLKGAKADPNGYPARYSGCGGPGFCASLVGRIADGTPFLLGAGGVVAAPAAGELQLGVNDYDWSDNSGSFRATVWTTAAGTAPTVALRPTGVVPAPGTTGASLRHALIAALLVALGAAVGLGLGRRHAPDPDVYVVGEPVWQPLEGALFGELVLHDGTHGLELRQGRKRGQLVALGDQFVTIADSEVLLHVEATRVAAFAVADGMARPL